MPYTEQEMQALCDVFIEAGWAGYVGARADHFIDLGSTIPPDTHVLSVSQDIERRTSGANHIAHIAVTCDGDVVMTEWDSSQNPSRKWVLITRPVWAEALNILAAFGPPNLDAVELPELVLDPDGVQWIEPTTHLYPIDAHIDWTPNAPIPETVDVEYIDPATGRVVPASDLQAGLSYGIRIADTGYTRWPDGSSGYTERGPTPENSVERDDHGGEPAVPAISTAVGGQRRPRSGILRGTQRASDGARDDDINYESLDRQQVIDRVQSIVRSMTPRTAEYSSSHIDYTVWNPGRVDTPVAVFVKWALEYIALAMDHHRYAAHELSYLFRNLAHDCRYQGRIMTEPVSFGTRRCSMEIPTIGSIIFQFYPNLNREGE